MTVTTYSHFRQNLKSLLDKVFTSNTPLYIKRKSSEDMVVLSKSDYDSLQETLHLLSSPKNAERLLSGIEKFKRGEYTEHNLID